MKATEFARATAANTLHYCLHHELLRPTRSPAGNWRNGLTGTITCAR